MNVISLLALAFAVSIDGFAAGLAYGIRKIKITSGSLILIGVTSALAIWFSMSMGRLMTVVISPGFAEILGGIILVTLGCWLIVQNLNINLKKRNSKVNSKEYYRFQEIISEPAKADIDGSGVISGKEALILGIALAMDAMAAGFGASLMGFHSLLTPLFVGACKLFLIPLGIKLGKDISSMVTNSAIVYLPGGILILLGVINFAI